MCFKFSLKQETLKQKSKQCAQGCEYRVQGVKRRDRKCSWKAQPHSRESGRSPKGSREPWSTLNRDPKGAHRGSMVQSSQGRHQRQGAYEETERSLTTP